MSDKDIATSGRSSAVLNHDNSHERLNFEEQSTFSDPVPRGNVFSSEASDSDEDGEALMKNPFLDLDVAEH